MKKKFEFVPRECGYSARVGSFARASAKLNKIIQTDHFFPCRETFSHYFGNRNSYILMLLANDAEAERIKKFMGVIERKLKLKADSKLSFNLVQPKRLLIGIPTWWRNSLLRRDFLTAALRHGRYYKGDFEKALKAQNYFKVTPEAVNKFLNGHTSLKRNSDYDGWVNFFNITNPLDQLEK